MNRTLVCCAAMSMFCSLMLAGCKTQSSAPAPREPLPVDIVAVKAADEAHWLETIGQAEAAAAVSVTTQATGRIIAQRYTEGDFVEAGAVLFQALCIVVVLLTCCLGFPEFFRTLKLTVSLRKFDFKRSTGCFCGR